MLLVKFPAVCRSWWVRRGRYPHHCVKQLSLRHEGACWHFEQWMLAERRFVASIKKTWSRPCFHRVIAWWHVSVVWIQSSLVVHKKEDEWRGFYVQTRRSICSNVRICTIDIDVPISKEYFTAGFWPLRWCQNHAGYQSRVTPLLPAEFGPLVATLCMELAWKLRRVCARLYRWARRHKMVAIGERAWECMGFAFEKVEFFHRMARKSEELHECLGVGKIIPYCAVMHHWYEHAEMTQIILVCSIATSDQNLQKKLTDHPCMWKVYASRKQNSCPRRSIY